jgi:uncharacterized protein (DUF608 family)
MVLALLAAPDKGSATAEVGKSSDAAARPVDAPEKLVGDVAARFALEPGESARVAFVLAWFFPNLRMDGLPPGRHYAARFGSALEVADYVAENLARLEGDTRLWRATWYGSTLPYWFLDRTLLNASILASSTCFRFGDGRFYGWEGVGCCKGTCTHVWHYAHSVARLFPELERDLRERVDFGLAQNPDGSIRFRGEFNNIPAADGQAGTLLRAYREHQCSPDDAFLRRIWPRARKALEWLIAEDGNGDGLLEGKQHNTLDADWYGPVAWLSGLYLAALAAGAAMADEAGEAAFAGRCRAVLEKGRAALAATLFEGEYFVNRPMPEHADAINSGTGCHIDQVMGQSWAWQVGLGRVLPERETLAALGALWKYNFAPDVGPYREANKAGRWYAMPGEAGLLMCTFPRSDWDIARAAGKGNPTFVGYFNECMNGFEYQVAGHMIWEGMLTEGLAVARAVHDRYHGSRRNPWNEVECGDHYARSMAAHGVYLAACGFEYHGPKRHIGFAPRLTPEKFKAAFTAAEGWGSYEQRREGASQSHRLDVAWGKVGIRTFACEVAGRKAGRVRAAFGGKTAGATFAQEGSRVTVTLESPAELRPGTPLEITIDLA